MVIDELSGRPGEGSRERYTDSGGEALPSPPVPLILNPASNNNNSSCPSPDDPWYADNCEYLERLAL